MKRLAILGYPLKHTMSPVLHQKLAACIGEEVSYEVRETAPEALPEKMGDLLKLDGFNVTIPYKLAVKDYLDRLDHSAQKHGAVNVVANVDGKHVGYNTDCIGFVRCLEAAGIPIEGRVCVVGLGGVGRMFATECAYRGCQMTFAVKRSAIEEMERQLATGGRTDLGLLREEIQWISGKPVHVIPTEELDEEFELLINASPVGMYPNTEMSPVSSRELAQVRAVFDCIYNPKETMLMRLAREVGCQVCGGMPMLVWQAVAAQEIWFDKSFTQTQVDQVLREMEEIL